MGNVEVDTVVRETRHTREVSSLTQTTLHLADQSIAFQHRVAVASPIRSHVFRNPLNFILRPIAAGPDPASCAAIYLATRSINPDAGPGTAHLPAVHLASGKED